VPVDAILDEVVERDGQFAIIAAAVMTQQRVCNIKIDVE
jgi:hypothetical protein